MEIDVSTQFDHVGVTVEDLDRSLAFYGDLLGFKVLRRRDRFSAPHIQTLVGLPGAELSVAMLEISPHAKLELIQYHSPEGRGIKAAPCDRGALHFALLVEDILACKDRLSAAGTHFVSDPQRSPNGPTEGTLFVYCRDPDGAILELIQPPRRSV